MKCIHMNTFTYTCTGIEKNKSYRLLTLSFCLLFCPFESRSHVPGQLMNCYVLKNNPEFLILLPKCWDHRYEPLKPTNTGYIKDLKLKEDKGIKSNKRGWQYHSVGIVSWHSQGTQFNT